MKKCVIVPDSFKGTMSAVEVCDVMAEKIREIFPHCRISSVPIADGGEGTVDCFIRALDGEKRKVRVTGPFGAEVESFYGVVRENTAVIEMAAAAGLGFAYGTMRPGEATTYGVGELIAKAVESGCKSIVLGLGGSCTNDGGAGMAAALGTKFFAEDGSCFVPAGDTLEKVVSIDNARTEAFLAGVEIQAMCDIRNPMFGENGAAFVFGPQKGAGPREVLELDRNLRAFAQRIEQDLGIEVSRIPGSGAAGAMGAGVCAFLGGKLVSGIELLLEAVGFDEMLKDADLVLTGEGKLDQQSFGGKVIAGVAAHARKFRVPVIAVAGCVEQGIQSSLAKLGVREALAVYDQPMPLEEILPRCKEDLGKAVGRLKNGVL